MQIEVLGLHINFSGYYFTQEGKKIRAGLMLVQGVSERAFDEIAAVRKGLPFSSLSDFCQRTDVKTMPHATVANLIKAGAFDALTPNRTWLLMELERALKRARKINSPGAAPGAESQLQLFDPSAESEASPARPDDQAFAPASRRDIQRYEREAIGSAITFDLLESYEDLMRAMRAVSPFEVSPRMEGKTVYVAGFVDHIEREGSLIDAETEMVLDMEGCVVRVPPGLASMVARIQNARGPALVEGVVGRSQSECYLTAQRVYLLEEVARQAEEVCALRLNLAGENRQTLRILRGALKPFKGQTRVEIENYNGLSWWGRRLLGNTKVFFCPPLSQTLSRILSEDQITLFNAEGIAIRR